MSKPIFVIKAPERIIDECVKDRHRLAKELGYNVIIAPTTSEEFQFELFSVENAEEIKFDELQSKVTDILKETSDKVDKIEAKYRAISQKTP